MSDDAPRSWKWLAKPDIIFFLLTILVSLGVLIPDIMGLIIVPLDSAILVVVAGLAAALMASGYRTMTVLEPRLETLQGIQERIIYSLNLSPNACLQSRRDISSLEDFMEGATGVLFIGRTLFRVSGPSELNKRLLKGGCKLRFVTMDLQACDSNSLLAVVLDGNMEDSTRLFNAQLTSSLGNVERLQLLADDEPGSVALKVVEYVSNISFVLVDKPHNEGKVRVDVMPFQTDEDARPILDFSSEDPDPSWYRYFRDTCEKIWDQAGFLPTKAPGP